MLFIKTFKGYEDRVSEIDEELNNWVQAQAGAIEVTDIKIALAHEPGASSGMGDLIYCVVYRAKAPVSDVGPYGGMPEGFEA